MAHSLLCPHACPGARSGRRGFSLAELLVVLAILGLSIAVAIPLVSREITKVRIRAAAAQLAADLRVARVVAVSTRRPVNVQVAIDPANEYTLPGRRGDARRVPLPEGVRIVTSTSPIVFRPDGSVPGGAETVLEAPSSEGFVDRWVITIGTLGIAHTVKERVAAGGGGP